MSAWEAQDNAGVRVLSANRPEALNALNPSMVSGLSDALAAAVDDSNIRTLVLTGNGDAFSAGADLDLLENPEQNREVLLTSIPAMFDALVDFPKPLLLAVNGIGIGFGATLLGLADIVVMAEDARIRVPFSTLAVVPEACSSYTFPQIMGHQQAFWFLASGEWMNAQQCREAGLALEVTKQALLIDTTLRYAHKLSEFPTHTLVETKRLLRQYNREQLKAANRAEIKTLFKLLDHPACKEGIAAIREKRKPDYGQY